MVGPTSQTPVRVATRHATMQQQWGMAMAAALIACEDSVLRLVDVRDGREARSSRYEPCGRQGERPSWTYAQPTTAGSRRFFENNPST
ncbi:Uncharacterised protein [Mycobacteroides abscessus subsp. abscessus]|nr:Uncharacterised protein [Mycobacteroides abscessus subsp. abscessus]